MSKQISVTEKLSQVDKFGTSDPVAVTIKCGEKRYWNTYDEVVEGVVAWRPMLKPWRRGANKNDRYYS